MRKSARLGLAAVLLYAVFVLLGFVPRKGGTVAEPLQFASLILSGVVGFVAARNGSRWWLLVPGAAALTIAVAVALGSLAY